VHRTPTVKGCRRFLHFNHVITYRFPSSYGNASGSFELQNANHRNRLIARWPIWGHFLAALKFGVNWPSARQQIRLWDLLPQGPHDHQRTLFAAHKAALPFFLAAIAVFINEVNDKNALALSRDLGMSTRLAGFSSTRSTKRWRKSLRAKPFQPSAGVKWAIPSRLALYRGP
jgi:hypothetical protein